MLDLLILAGFYGLVKKKYSASKQELVQAVFVFVLTAFVVLTIIGIWFRGAGMRLAMPF